MNEIPAITYLTLPPSALDRFWKSVPVGSANSCWEWQGSRTRGYGYFQHRKQGMRAHRLSWYLANPTRTIPPDFHVCHECNNRACVNPSHLSVASAADNNEEVRWRRRYAFGVRVHLAKLNPTSVTFIRSFARQGWPHWSIAALFNVQRSTISRVVKRQTWKQVA